MRTFDPTPFWRSTVGFDRLFDMLDQTAQYQANDTYPPYNIERRRRPLPDYAGTRRLQPDEITITAEQNVLTVEGSKAQKPETNTSIRASPPVRSGVSSTLPNTCR
jgi:molecular chaperone IbpA